MIYLVEKLGGKGYFTKIDLKSGFWQIPMTDKSTEKTAFTTPWGLFEFVVMPFGLRNAPATFKRLMNHVLRAEITEGFTIVYMDDIIIYSEELYTRLEHIKAVLSKKKRQA